MSSLMPTVLVIVAAGGFVVAGASSSWNRRFAKEAAALPERPLTNQFVAIPGDLIVSEITDRKNPLGPTAVVHRRTMDVVTGAELVDDGRTLRIELEVPKSGLFTKVKYLKFGREAPPVSGVLSPVEESKGRRRQFVEAPFPAEATGDDALYGAMVAELKTGETAAKAVIPLRLSRIRATSR